MSTTIISINGHPLADTQARASVTALETRAGALEQADTQMSASVTALGSRVDALEQTGGSSGSAAIDDAATAADTTWSSSKIAQEVGSRLAQATFDRVFTITEPSINLYEPTTEGWEDNAMIVTSGAVTVNESTYAKYCVTPPIPIEGGKTYTCAPALGPTSLADKNRARTYTEAGAAFDAMTFTINEDGSATFTTPVGSAYIRFTANKETLTLGTNLADTIAKFNTRFMLVEGTSAPESFVPYIPAQNTLRNIEIPDGSVKLSKIGGDARPLLLPLAGKTIANFGDSIFGNARPPLDVSTFLAEGTGAAVRNCAFGGCRMGPHTGHWDAFSMYRLAEAIAGGDYSVQDEAINYDDRTSYAEEPLAEIKSIDFSALDILTIAYGTNDFTGANPIDNADDPLDTSTVCGALRYSIKTMLTAFPQLHIFVLLPTYRFTMDDDGNFSEDSSAMTNSLGRTLPEYVQAMAEAARAYGVPVVDNYHGLGVNRWSRAQYFSGSDGVHLNEAGRRLMAARLARELW